jgi:hypothetical protein
MNEWVIYLICHSVLTVLGVVLCAISDRITGGEQNDAEQILRILVISIIFPLITIITGLYFIIRYGGKKKGVEL